MPSEAGSSHPKTGAPGTEESAQWWASDAAGRKSGHEAPNWGHTSNSVSNDYVKNREETDTTSTLKFTQDYVKAANFNNTSVTKNALGKWKNALSEKRGSS